MTTRNFCEDCGIELEESEYKKRDGLCYDCQCLAEAEARRERAYQRECYFSER